MVAKLGASQQMLARKACRHTGCAKAAAAENIELAVKPEASWAYGLICAV